MAIILIPSKTLHPSGCSKHHIDAPDIDRSVNVNGIDGSFEVFRWMKYFPLQKTMSTKRIFSLDLVNSHFFTGRSSKLTILTAIIFN